MSIITNSTRHKLLMLSHSPANARLMGKLVADGKQVPIQAVYAQYESLLIKTGF